MSELIYGDVKELLTKIGSMFNTTAEKAYQVMWKQGDVHLIYTALFGLFLFGLITVIYFLITTKKEKGKGRRWKSFEEVTEGVDYDDEDDGSGVAVILGIIAIVLLIIFSFEIVEAIQIIFNREYWILKEIIRMLNHKC